MFSKIKNYIIYFLGVLSSILGAMFLIQRQKKIELESELDNANLNLRIKDKKDEVQKESLDDSIDKFFDRYKSDTGKRD